MWCCKHGRTQTLICTVSLKNTDTDGRITCNYLTIAMELPSRIEGNYFLDHPKLGGCHLLGQINSNIKLVFMASMYFIMYPTH